MVCMYFVCWNAKQSLDGKQSGPNLDGNAVKFYDCIGKYFTGAKRQIYTEAMGYENTSICITDIEDGFFNFIVETFDSHKSIYCCDAGAFLILITMLFAMRYRNDDIIALRDVVSDIYDDYKQNYKKPNDKNFMRRMKAELDAKVRLPMMTMIEGVAHQLISGVYADFVKRHKGPRIKRKHSDIHKNKAIVQMPRSNRKKKQQRKDDTPE